MRRALALCAVALLAPLRDWLEARRIEREALTAARWRAYAALARAPEPIDAPPDAPVSVEPPAPAPVAPLTDSVALPRRVVPFRPRGGK